MSRETMMLHLLDIESRDDFGGSGDGDRVGVVRWRRLSSAVNPQVNRYLPGCEVGKVLAAKRLRVRARSKENLSVGGRSDVVFPLKL